MQRCIRMILSVVVTAALVVPAKPSTAQPSVSSREETTGTGGVLFIENVGQFADGARFQVRGSDHILWLADDALWLTALEPQQEEMPRSLSGSFDALPEESPRPGVHIKLGFAGDNPHSRLEPFDRQEAAVSYFRGNDPAQWRAAVPVWRGVRYVDLYPGVDLLLVDSEGRVAMRWEVRAGANLDAVRLRWRGQTT